MGVVELRIEFSGLGAPELAGRTEPYVFVHVEADVTVYDDGREFWREESFPVVELAAALWEWKKVPSPTRKDFEFESLSLEDRWRVRIVRSSAGWRLLEDGTGKKISGCAWSAESVDAEVERFSGRLRTSCIEIFGAWIGKFLPPAADFDKDA